jgi:hypothetical protein
VKNVTASPILFLCLCSLLIFSHSTCLAALNLKDQTINITANWLGDNPNTPHVAYNSQQDEYLVVYHYRNSTLFPALNARIDGARISATGEYIENFVISDLANDCKTPDVIFDPEHNNYLVVWTYDANGDTSDFDLHGRIIPWDGPNAMTPASFPLSQMSAYHELSPRVSYSSLTDEFVVVNSLVRNDGFSILPYVAGNKVAFDGSGIVNLAKPEFSIFNNSEPRINPAITYNPVLNEFLVAWDNTSDVFASRVNAQTLYVTGEVAITERPGSPLPGTHDRPSISFSPQTSDYLISFDSDRLAGTGKIWVSIFSGLTSTPSGYSLLRLDENDGDRPDFGSAISCFAENRCLVYWVVVNNNTYFTFGRQIFPDTVFEGGYPFNNLNTIATWGSEKPQLAVAAGRKNYLMAFSSYNNGNKQILGRQSEKIAFPWNLFLPAILNPKN